MDNAFLRHLGPRPSEAVCALIRFSNIERMLGAGSARAPSAAMVRLLGPRRRASAGMTDCTPRTPLYDIKCRTAPT
jgi:hypothetical protein